MFVLMIHACVLLVAVQAGGTLSAYLSDVSVFEPGLIFLLSTSSFY